jgi:uncharacterized protein
MAKIPARLHGMATLPSGPSAPRKGTLIAQSSSDRRTPDSGDAGVPNETSQGAAMQIEHHDLHHEFPEHKERIHELKISDTRFAKLFNQYDQLDHMIRRVEEAGALMSDSEMEAMKMERVHLKDKLYAYLKNA